MCSCYSEALHVRHDQLNFPDVCAIALSLPSHVSVFPLCSVYLGFLCSLIFPSPGTLFILFFFGPQFPFFCYSVQLVSVCLLICSFSVTLVILSSSFSLIKTCNLVQAYFIKIGRCLTPYAFGLNICCHDRTCKWPGQSNKAFSMHLKMYQSHTCFV